MDIRHIRTACVMALVGLVVALATPAWAQDSDDVLVIDQPIDHDVYAARRELNVQTSIAGDLVAAGQHVTVDGAVDGDMIVAAQDIEIRSGGADDVRVAGQHIRITSPVAGHVVAAGQTITVAESIGDWAWLAGQTVDVVGDVGGDLKIRGQSITINAEVTGDVAVTGDELHVGPEAIVHGNLTWRSENEADISEDARIAGEFIEEPVPGIAEKLLSGRALSFTISVIVAVVLLFLLFSRLLRSSSGQIAEHPGASLGLGLAVMGGVPVCGLILLFSPLDAWVGLSVIGGFVILLLFGVLTGLFALSDLVLRRFRSNPARWQALVAIPVAVVAVGLLSYVPYLGTVAVMIIWILGLGALCWGGWMALRGQGQEQLLKQ